MAVANSRIQDLADRRETAAEMEFERWVHWPINWSAVWVGALAALVAVLLFGLIGVAIGAHLLGAEDRIVDLKKLGIGALIFSVLSAFFAFVIGGWIAGKIAGILRSEPAMLHGAVTWCLAVPLLVTLAAVGASNYSGGWFASLAGKPHWPVPFDRPDPLGADATLQDRAQFKMAQAEYAQKVRQWKEETPQATRNSAIAGATALLLALMGSVIGGWMASGEPMNFTHYRTRKTLAARQG